MNATKVMIVEDNTTVAKDLSCCLADLGYEVTSIEVSGEESVEKAGIDSPDIVLMDIHLRDKMRGIEAAELIHDKYDLPVVFLSAYSNNDLLEKAKLVGAFGYLVKPFEERELFATIEMAIYKAKAEKERLHLEARLAQMRKKEGLQVMAASIAHNFNNILQTPLGYYDLMEESLPPESECHNYIKSSRIAFDRAVKISQLMLVYVGSGQKEFADINLAAEMRKILAGFRDGLSEKHTLNEDLASGAAMIRADNIQFKDLMMALLTNAIEAIGSETGEVQVTTRVISATDQEFGDTFEDKEITASEFVMIVVSDTGCGMDSDTITKLYDPFFSTKFTGRGLGMAVAQGIIQGHDGAIAVQSEPGQGTVMKIVFPVTVAPHQF